MLSASMSIDGGTATLFSPTATQTAAITYGNQIFSSSQLSQGFHTLQITSLNPSPLWIDYFLVNPGLSESTASSSPSGTAIPVSTTASLSTSSTATGLPGTPTTTSLNSASARNPVSTGAIAGIVVGGLLLLAGLVALLLFFHHHQRKGENHTVPPSPCKHLP